MNAWVAVCGFCLVSVFASTSNAGFCCPWVDRTVLSSSLTVGYELAGDHSGHPAGWMFEKRQLHGSQGKFIGSHASGSFDAVHLLRLQPRGNGKVPSQEHGPVSAPFSGVGSCSSPSPSENDSRSLSGGILFDSIVVAPDDGHLDWSRPTEYLLFVSDAQFELLRPPIFAA